MIKRSLGCRATLRYFDSFQDADLRKTPQRNGNSGVSRKANRKRKAGRDFTKHDRVK